MGQFSTITQDIKIKLKMKFLIPLLVIFATSDAFFGIGRKSDSRDANPTNIDTEELARLLGEILVKELRNHNNNNKYNNNNTPRPVHTYTPRPVPAYTPEPVHTYTPEPIVTIEPDHIIYNTEPEVVHTYEP